MFKIDKATINLRVGKWSQGRIGSPFATSRKLSRGSAAAPAEAPASAVAPKALNREVCALLEEAAFITRGSQLGAKRRRLTLPH